jgi:RNA polymerase sigma-70 factor (ECF subfamily)
MSPAMTLQRTPRERRVIPHLVNAARSDAFRARPRRTTFSRLLRSPGDGREELTSLPDPKRLADFTAQVTPHLAAAYGLARWLLGNDHDAEDAAQDAYVRAYRFFDGFHGVNARAWLLTITRRCCYALLEGKGPDALRGYDEQEGAESEVSPPVHGSAPDDPDRALARANDARLLNEAVERLAVEQREVFVLREVEGLSYKEIADVAGIPIGTVMSRLSRARAQLQRMLREDESR